jgi:hypothetical protein
LADVLALTELTYRYAFLIDGRQWDALGELFTDDVELDYGLPDGRLIRGRDAFVNGSRLALEQMDATHHMFTNHLFEIDGDRASGRYYMQGTHMKLDAPGGALHHLGGVYEDEFVRTGDGWKVSKRRYRAIWGRGNNAFNPGFRTDEPSAGPREEQR